METLQRSIYKAIFWMKEYIKFDYEEREKHKGQESAFGNIE